MNLASVAREEFDVEVKNYPKSQRISDACMRAYIGAPDWIDEDDGVTTVNLANTIASEVARLTMLGTKITAEGSARATYIQKIIDANYAKFRQWAEYAAAIGTIIIKPNGTDFDIYTPSQYFVTSTFNGEIWGAVFLTQKQSDDGKLWYSRLEYHRFSDNGQYTITNKCYVGESRNDASERVDIKNTPWYMLDEEVTVDGLEKPLFAVLRTPAANYVDIDSPCALPVFASAMQELQDVDIAYSRYIKEIDESKRTVLIDSDRLMVDGGSPKNKNSKIGSLNAARKNMGLPDYVRAVEGTGEGNIYTEINPTLNTAVRLQGINHLLSQIGYKVGFANGYFVFNEASGIQTATGVEANQQRTIQFIKDCRDQMEKALSDLVEAIDKFADLYSLAPVGKYELTYNFGDITYNEDEDRARYLTYVSMGKFPFWRYLVKFEGYGEEEARGIEQEAMTQAQGMEGMFAEE